MLKLFRKSVLERGLLHGATDNHSHILYGVDDGVRTREESLAILSWLEEQGLSELWLTPHIMEDVPNTTEGLKARFEELKAVYNGPIKFHLAAEYMMDTLFEERFRARDLLWHGENTVLVETSTVAPPVNFWDMLFEMMSADITPLLAHPERYRYMDSTDYRKLHEMGVKLQMNLPSIAGYYGKTVQARAKYLLDKGWICMTGSDCHRFRVIRHQYSAKELSPKQMRQLRPLMEQ